MLALLLPMAAAFPWVEVVDGPITHDEHDAVLEDAAGRAPAHADHVRIMVRQPDGTLRDAEQTLPKLPPVPDKAAAAPPGAPVDHPGSSEGSLSGRAVYLSQCHGWLYNTSYDRYLTQRGNLYDTVEDLHNPEGANQYLTAYLENAGAAVYTVRERGLIDEMAVVDDGDPGYEEAGAGFVEGPEGYVHDPPWAYGEDPFDVGTTRNFPADGGATATWTVDVPVAGDWPVYVSWEADAGHAPDAHYRITHPGGVIDRRFDQRVHGATWQYAETLYLPAGEAMLTVELVGDSQTAGATLSADAVRIGGGLGDVMRGGSTTGRPRWEDGGIIATQWNSAPPSVYDPSYDGNGSDPSSRSRWADWEHPSGEDALYVSWHSNAGGGTGTSTYTYEGSRGPATDGSWELGELLQEEIVAAIRTQWDADWTSRGHRTAAFSEVSPAHNDEMPSALIELAFHDHPVDVDLLKDPAFRRDASRAMARAIIRYYAERDGLTAVFPPEPPEAVSVLHDADGALVAAWSDGPIGAPWGDTPTGWRVQTSTDGRTWSNGIDTASRRLALPVALGDTIFVRVSARNAGGISFPSEVLGGRRSPDGTAVALVVPAFDRLETSMLPWGDVGGAVGDVRRGNLRHINRFDGVVAHGAAITAAGWYWESASDEATSGLAPGSWPLLIWAAGEESTRDESYSDAQQAWVRAHLDAGGALWSSGAEVLWDLDHRGSATDQAFALEILGASMAEDDAGSTLVSGEDIWTGLRLDFGWEHGDTIPVEYPDTLGTDRSPIARYETGGVAAALGSGVLHMGFPFETIGDAATRDAAAEAALVALVPDHTPPELQEDDPNSGDDTDMPDVDDGPAGPAAGGGGDTAGCGCGAPTAPAAPALALLGLMAVARRRR